MDELLQRLKDGSILSQWDFLELLKKREFLSTRAMEEASRVRDRVYGRRVFLRALLEYSSFCVRDCYYCGLRRSNAQATRYRLKEDQLAETARVGYQMGFRTLVLQGGEDPFFTDEVLCRIIHRIKESTPGAALTLSCGERSYESYQRLKAAGADRYLLRHESRNPEHYGLLHPDSMTIERRITALRQLKTLGFQTGAGMMVGSPHQKLSHLAEDLLFLQELRPQMVGIGPFIHHPDTPFAQEKDGDVELSLYLLALVRLLLPNSLIPATTALASLSEEGRIRALDAGANVLMPNLSPLEHRGDYAIYQGKKSLQLEGAEGIQDLQIHLADHGYLLSFERGDAEGENNV